jgi:hypothetical protein
MKETYNDKRKAIAGEFFINDSRMKNRSRKAFKKIQIYKASTNNASLDTTYQQQIQNLIRYSFFDTISSAEILLNEQFFDRPSFN